ncbi:MAG: 4-hydroxy-4-methyl-2-oxoglutarate aldolase [Chloroflexi bacterium]|nr:MAG: 4-hydroxy-4-methyl-2-oxoglutarate aldolase [Chloroflexota bacterium]
MVLIRPRVADRVPRETLETLRGIPPATIGHMLDFGFMDRQLRPYGRRRFTICGPAVTVRCMAIDSSVVHHAISLAEPGDVLVIDRNGDDKHAAWGEMTSLAAKLRGLAGTIIDGPATDIVEIEEMEYLVFARGIAPITTRGLASSGEINTTVQCGGVVVQPGDIILADDNGVLVLAPDVVEEVVQRCLPRVEREAMIRARLLAGEALGEITGATPRLLATQDQ